MNHIDVGLSFHLANKMGSIDPKIAELWPFSLGLLKIWLSPKMANWRKGPNENGHSSVIFGSIDPIFSQMEAKTYIYVVQCHFWANLFILVPNLKHKVRNSRFRGLRNFRFSTSTAPVTDHRNFLILNLFTCLSYVNT